MPPLQPQPAPTPYNQVLSALRKDDLIRLSRELRLPPEGSVVTLRNRLRVYLNAHREVLYRNQRYKSLYPKRRQLNIDIPPPPPPPDSPPPSPAALSYVSDAPSWHGIGYNHQNQSPPAQSPHQQSFSPPPMPQGLEDDYYPPPSPTPDVSDFNFPPQEVQVAGMLVFLLQQLFMSPFPYPVTYSPTFYVPRAIETLCSPNPPHLYFFSMAPRAATRTSYEVFPFFG